MARLTPRPSCPSGLVQAGQSDSSVRPRFLEKLDGRTRAKSRQLVLELDDRMGRWRRRPRCGRQRWLRLRERLRSAVVGTAALLLLSRCGQPLPITTWRDQSHRRDGSDCHHRRVTGRDKRMVRHTPPRSWVCGGSQREMGDTARTVRTPRYQQKQAAASLGSLSAPADPRCANRPERPARDAAEQFDPGCVLATPVGPPTKESPRPGENWAVMTTLVVFV